MIVLTPFLILAPGGVHVTVVGEGKLRFAVGRKVATAVSATLSANAQGVLVDEAGRPVSPLLRVPAGPLKIAMNGTVSVAGRAISRLVLERKGAGATEIGYPGEDGFAILQVEAAARPVFRSSGGASSHDLQASEPSIDVHPTSEVEGDRILLGGIADLGGDPATVARLAKIDLGALPPVGSRRILGKWSLMAALRDAGFRDLTPSFPPDVTVSRKAQTVAVDAMVAEAEAKARELVQGDVALAASPGAVVAPLGETTLRAKAERVGDSDALRVEITVLVNGKEVATRTVGFRDRTPGIKVGDAVRILVERGGAVVEMDGKAKTAGRVGGTIQVTTADGAVLTATATDPNTVEIKL